MNKLLVSVLLGFLLTNSVLACKNGSQSERVIGSGKTETEAMVDLENRINILKNKEGFKQKGGGGKREGSTYYKWQDVEYCK